MSKTPKVINLLTSKVFLHLLEDSGESRDEARKALKDVLSKKGKDEEVTKEATKCSKKNGKSISSKDRAIQELLRQGEGKKSKSRNQ